MVFAEIDHVETDLLGKNALLNKTAMTTRLIRLQFSRMGICQVISQGHQSKLHFPPLLLPLENRFIAGVRRMDDLLQRVDIHRQYPDDGISPGH